MITPSLACTPNVSASSGDSSLGSTPIQPRRTWPSLHDAVEHLARGGHRNGKANAHAAARARIDGRVDALQIAFHINPGAARVTWVDGRIGLDEIFEGVDAQLVAPQRRDDAAGDRLPTPNGLPMASTWSPTSSWSDSPSTITGSLSSWIFKAWPDRFLGRCRSPRGAAAVGERDLDLVGALDHVVVGQDVAPRG